MTLFADFAEIALKSILLSGLGLLILRLVRGRSAAEQSFLAHAVLAALLILPFVALRFPDISLPVLPAAVEAAPSMAVTEIPSEGAAIEAAAPLTEAPAAVIASAPSVDLAPWLMLGLLIPTLILLCGIGIGLMRLVFLKRRANVLVDDVWLTALARAQKRMGFKEGAALLVSRDVNSPLSWGFIRPTILLDEESATRPEEAEAIIAHELAHVVRMDWLKVLLARIVTACFWFNPLAWRLAVEAHQLREESADDAVLQSDVEHAAYATLLVKAVRHQNKAPLMPAHGVAPLRGSLKRRVSRIMDKALPRHTASARWGVASAVGLAAILFPVSMATGVPAQASAQEASSAPSAEAGETAASAKRGSPSIDDLIDMKIHGVTTAYIAELEAADPRFKNASYDQIVAFRIHGVDADFVGRLYAMGYRDASFSDIEDAAIHGVSASYAEDLAKAGYTGLDLGQLVDFRIHGVSADSIRSLMNMGLTDLSADDIESAAIHGISPAYADKMASAGLTNLTFDELLDLKIAGVTPEFINAFRDAGYQDLTAEEAADLKMHGVRIEDLERNGR